ncbi:MAG: tRNA threonylcarbamoyl adenosine modification protein YjeE [Gammaproteobacteria bacterium]|nr:tRNA threonylcarbamoyl adenosine modification protein YjeE [Gammaproteobacteria bacterium]
MVAQADQLIKVATSMEMEALGQRYAAGCPAGARIYLQGDLGAGKTTWVRGFLRGWQYTGTVKSPTYTLVETYHVHGQTIHHLDLYRINDPDELESIGIREYLDGAGICLVEWPEKGGELLAAPDIMVGIAMNGFKRNVRMQSYSSTGTQLLAALE